MRRELERRAADRADAIERDERYQQLVELAPDAILIHDGERVVLANAAAVQLAGATRRDQVVGLPIDTFLAPPYLKAAEISLTADHHPLELAPPVRDTLRRLDGFRVQVEVRAIAFLDRGRPAVHLVVRDITERLALEAAGRQVEHQLQQAQKMDAVGMLAGGMAHEVNNMMTVILGLSEFLCGNPEMPAPWLADVRGISKAAERAAAVTRQLLAFSRRAFSQPQVVDLGVTVRDLAPLVQRLLGESRQLAVVSLGAPPVWADRAQLEQVIVNLALNARDAMPSGGTLTITTTETEMATGVPSSDGEPIASGRYAVISVQDTGGGMDAVTKAHIFEPFFTTKPVGQGTGLGLAAAYGIMKQNHGYITIASAPGQGAVFTLYLPTLGHVAETERTVPPPEAGRSLPHGGATILVVEDEAAVLAIATRSLERDGFRVLQAFDGASALEVVARHGPPHLVLTDLLLPDIGGAELARRLRERWPALPILFMSGYSAEDLRRQGAMGLEAVTIQKPFTPDGLVGNVAAALSGIAVGHHVRATPAAGTSALD
jgi:PAS domain S-box-containing protein